MKIVTGVDLVYLPRFKKARKNGGEIFLRRVFTEKELDHPGGGIEHLAGIFAAKEAVMKALSLPADSWHDIKITNIPSGVPKVTVDNQKFSIVHSSLSISHDGGYVIAQFVGILEDDATN